MLIPYNPASKATPPKLEKPAPNYFQPEDIEKIRECLENESLKYKVLVHLMLITGARRGEIAGLRWRSVDWNNNQLHIIYNLLYSSDRGLYIDTPKTSTSDHFIKLPAKTMELLRTYKEWQDSFAIKCGTSWNNEVMITGINGVKQLESNDFIFTRDNGDKIGYPMHPDSITQWCSTFSEKYGLPHINPHAFRHTMASILYFNGIDSISISSRLGHAKPSTTTDMYSHIIKEADERSAECIADIFLK